MPRPKRDRGRLPNRLGGAFPAGPRPSPSGPPDLLPTASPPANWRRPASRILLGGLAALVVARPLVAGYDPGRLRLDTASGALVLNLLVFTLLFAWGGLRGLVRGRPRGIGGRAVGLGLLAVAGLAFASAGLAAAYQRPAWFIAWEWTAVLALFFLTRQLAAESDAARGLLNVLLATAITLSALAAYQEVAVRASLPTAEILPPVVLVPLAGTPEEDAGLDPPGIAWNTPRATFDRPETFAAFLLLLLPAALVVGVSGWRTRTGPGRLALLAALLLPVCLILTLQGVSLSQWWEERLRGWEAAVAVIREAPLLGVGPGNFTRAAGGVESHSFWLELAATVGVCAPLALLAAGAIFMLSVVRGPSAEERSAAASRLNENIENVSDDGPRTTDNGPRWSFYLGGVGGLLLGFALSVGERPAEEPPRIILQLGAIAAMRSLIWFGAFALLEGTPYRNRAAGRALAIGILLATGFGIASDRIGLPTLLQPLAVAAGLALTLAGRPRPTPESEAAPGPRAASLGGILGRWAGLPVGLGLLVAYFLHVAAPGVWTASAVREARRAGPHFYDLRMKAYIARGIDKVEAAQRAEQFLRGNILQPLSAAADADTGNAALRVEIARWGREHWQLLLVTSRVRKSPQQALHDLRVVADRMLTLADRAAQLDPRNPAGPLSAFDSYLMLLREAKETNRARLRTQAEEKIAAVAQIDPSREARLYGRLAETLYALGEPAAVNVAKRALVLDRDAPDDRSRLTPEQRARLLRKFGDPSPEELEKLLRE